MEDMTEWCGKQACSQQEMRTRLQRDGVLPSLMLFFSTLQIEAILINPVIHTCFIVLCLNLQPSSAVHLKNGWNRTRRCQTGIQTQEE